MRDWRNFHDDQPDLDDAPATGVTPGKLTLTGELPPLRGRAVQRSTDGHGGHGPGGGDHEAAEIAAEGVAGNGGPLPHLDQIQHSFGRHDVAGVAAHTGTAAAQAAGALGAGAYAFGNAVAFAGAPSLHTAAHEAAHVIQQRGGVSLPGGVGQEGDAYERHADAVADKVAAGQSAESLLDQVSGGGGGVVVDTAVQARAAGARFGQAVAARYVQRRGAPSRPVVQRTRSNGVSVSDVRFAPAEIKDDGATKSQASASYSARISSGAALKWSIEGAAFGTTIDTATGLITPATDTVPIDKDKVKIDVKAIDSKEAGAHATGHLTLWSQKYLKAKEDYTKFIGSTYSQASFVSTETKWGKFDVKYSPAAKSLDVTVKVKFDFLNDGVKGTPKWKANQKAAYIATFMERARNAWSGQWQFVNAREPKLVWKKLGPVSVRTQAKQDNASPHFAITVHKKDKRPVVRPTGTAEFDPSHQDWQKNPEPFPKTKQAEIDALTSKLPTPVQFATGSAVLPAGSQGQLEFVGTYLHSVRNPKFRLTITGHTAPDPAAATPAQKTAAAKAAMTLSRQRATAVQTAIASRGVGAHSLTTAAKGNTAGTAAPAGDKVEIVAADPRYKNSHHYLAHEFGHMLGLGDEYTDPAAGNAKGDKTRHYGLTEELLGKDYADSFAKIQDDSEGIMNGGTDVRPHHYVTLWEALGQVSGTAAAPAPPFSRTDWKISGM